MIHFTSHAFRMDFSGMQGTSCAQVNLLKSEINIHICKKKKKKSVFFDVGEGVDDEKNISNTNYYFKESICMCLNTCLQGIWTSEKAFPVILSLIA